MSASATAAGTGPKQKSFPPTKRYLRVQAETARERAETEARYALIGEKPPGYPTPIAPEAYTPRHGLTLEDEVLQFFRNLRVPEGPLLGQPWQLLDYQREVIAALCDPLVRRLIVSIPRKAGKTAFAAAILLCCICGPLSRRNSQVFSAARSRDQASLVYSLALKIAQQTPWMMPELKVTDSRKFIKGLRFNVEYRALAADAQKAHGLSPVFVIHDELGQVSGPTDDLYDALETAFGAQVAPKSLIISTQAAEDDDLLSTLIDDALASGDERTRVLLYAADRNADPWSEETWKRCHPAYGLFRNPVEFREAADRAQRLPSAELSFRRYYLNQRVTGETGFVTPSVWRANARPAIDELFRSGAPVYGALDLSARQDLTALVLACEDEAGDVHVQTHAWSPEDTLVARAARDRAPYITWRERGFLRTTPGSSVSYGHVVADIRDIIEGMNLVSVAFDRWRINEFRRDMDRLGVELPLRECGQGFKDMSPRIEASTAILLDHKVRHGGNPVLTMAASSCKVVRDPAGNAKLDKGKTYGRIDPAVAMVMALGEMRVSSATDSAGACPMLIL